MRGGTGARNAKALTKKLAELVGGQGRTTKKGQSHPTSKRVDVVNGDLCGTFDYRSILTSLIH